jgi:CubicO group peptidase (beta-lactamase class C family)
MLQPQGQVSDENAYALGGIAGHAGVFSNVYDLMKLMRALVFAPSYSGRFLNASTVAHFTTVHNVSQSSRALGWDTNNYIANTYRGCSQLSSSTFTHTGYTGTQLCGDIEREIITILLTNRCYPVKAAQMDTIHTVRQEWNDAVLAIYNSMHNTSAHAS